MNDITERSLLEERVRQGEKLEALGRFAGGIAHDFNNLLAIIIGYVRLALERHDTVGETRRGMELVAETAERAAALTRRLLAFSRQQARDVHLLDLNAVTAGMSDMVSRLVGEHVSLYIRGAPDIWPVRADRVQVEQIVLNLASNSADAMPAGGALVIETANLAVETLIACFPDSIPPGRYVRLQVRDTGSGVPARGARAHLRAVLHHQGAGEGDRSRAGHRVRGREAERRPHLPRDRARRGDHVLHLFPGAGGVRGGRHGSRGARRGAARR